MVTLTSIVSSRRSEYTPIGTLDLESQSQSKNESFVNTISKTYTHCRNSLASSSASFIPISQQPSSQSNGVGDGVSTNYRGLSVTNHDKGKTTTTTFLTPWRIIAVALAILIFIIVSLFTTPRTFFSSTSPSGPTGLDTMFPAQHELYTMPKSIPHTNMMFNEQQKITHTRNAHPVSAIDQNLEAFHISQH